MLEAEEVFGLIYGKVIRGESGDGGSVLLLEKWKEEIVKEMLEKERQERSIPGAPLTEEDIAAAEKVLKSADDWRTTYSSISNRTSVEEYLGKTLKHIYFLNSLIADAVGSGEMVAYRAGEVKGYNKAIDEVAKFLNDDQEENLAGQIRKWKKEKNDG